MGRVVIPGFRKIETSGGGEGGTTNYNDLTNKPSINNVPLTGNLNTVDLKLTDATLTEEGVPAEAKTVGAKLEEQSTSLTALSEQLGNHTVKSDVPIDAVFTDTIYDDTEVKESIEELNSNLDTLEFGEVAGGKNLLYTDEFVGKSVLAENNIGGVAPTGNSITFTMSTTTDDDLSGGNSILYIIRKDGSNSSPVYPNNTLQLTDADRNNFANYRINFVSGLVGKTIKICQIEKGTTATPYEPYIPSVKMLAEENARQNDSLSSLGKCKNLLKPTLQTTTQNGVTCTANGDGTYTLNGTANANTQFEIKARGVISKQIRLVGCPMGGSDKSYNIVVVNYNGSDIRDNGNGITIPTNTECAIKIYVESGTTLSNKVFKPMLTTNLTATIDDFVPYTGDCDTLMDDVASLLKRIETLESLVNKTDTTNATITE